MPNCRLTQKSFTVTEADRNFYAKIEVPEPTLCPTERLRRRMAYRNDMTLYRSKCAKTGKPIISQFAPDSGFTVYDREVWWSDDWDPFEYGRDYDFAKSFFSQFYELQRAAPHPNVTTVNAENSDYTNYNLENRNCYMCFTGNHLQDSLYCYNADSSKDCCDCLFVWDCQYCYECVNCVNCYEVQFGLHATNCSSSYFIEDCRNCKNCAFCYGLDYAEYCIFNKQYTKEQYLEELAKLQFDSLEGQQNAFALWRQESPKFPKRADQNYQCESCSGDYMHQCKNCHDCYIMSNGCEDCRYVFNGFQSLKEGMDCLFSGAHVELLYETVASGERGGNLYFCNVCVCGSSDLMYCDLMINCKDCFACCGLRNQQYCILNKQYTKEDYLALRAKIIEHMKSTLEFGEFFSPEFSPYGYNESFASVWMPLQKQDAIARGYKWKDIEDITTAEARELPTGAKICTVSGKPFKIIDAERKFYARFGIPEPTKCFEVRHQQRLALRRPMDGWG